MNGQHHPTLSQVALYMESVQGLDGCTRAEVLEACTGRGIQIRESRVSYYDLGAIFFGIKDRRAS